MNGFFSFLAAALLAGAPVAAAQAASAPQTRLSQSEHTQTLSRVEEYLNRITTLRADFVQIAPDGSLATGQFFLKRPGKMRWQYDPPVPVLMISNGRNLTYYDYELDQVSHIPLDETLAGFLARERISFDPKVIEVAKVESAHEVIRITLRQKNKPEDGELTLELADHPLILRNMIITDASGKETNVSLNNAEFGVALEKDLFVFRDPRIFRR